MGTRRAVPPRHHLLLRHLFRRHPVQHRERQHPGRRRAAPHQPARHQPRHRRSGHRPKAAPHRHRLGRFRRDTLGLHRIRPRSRTEIERWRRANIPIRRSKAPKGRATERPIERGTWGRSTIQSSDVCLLSFRHVSRNVARCSFGASNGSPFCSRLGPGRRRQEPSHPHPSRPRRPRTCPLSVPPRNAGFGTNAFATSPARRRRPHLGASAEAACRRWRSPAKWCC